MTKPRTAAAKPVPATPQGIPSRNGDWIVYRDGTRVLSPIPQLPPVNPYATFNRG